MPAYRFTAKNMQTGRERSGVMEVKDERTLFYQLRSEGFLLTSHTEETVAEASPTYVWASRMFSHVSLKDKMVFARNLSIMISSGVQLTKAIRTLRHQTKNPYFQKVLEDVSDNVQTGSSLGEALAKHKDVFNELFVSMVRVGEAGGGLEEVLQIVAVQLEKEHSLVSKVRGAMLYPAIIILAMIGVGVLMLTYILPQITGVFEGMDVELPATTQFIITLSEFLRGHAFLSLGATLAGIVAFGTFARTEAGSRTFSFVLLRIPVVRDIVTKTNSARFARIYSSLMRSGVSVVEALGIIAQTLSNYYYKRSVLESVEAVQKGIPLSTSLTDGKIFPTLVCQIVEVGEATGKTDEVLLRLAEFYEGDVDQMTKNMSSIIEPVLMIVIGLGVGFFAVAMLTPMYSMMENVR